jgi:hypothetical protein
LLGLFLPEDEIITVLRNARNYSPKRQRHIPEDLKVNVKVTLEQATKAQRGSRRRALLFL